EHVDEEEPPRHHARPSLVTAMDEQPDRQSISPGVALARDRGEGEITVCRRERDEAPEREAQPSERPRNAENEPGQRVDAAADHAANGHGPGGNAAHLVIAVAHDTALSKLSCPELTQGLPSKPRANRVGAPRRDERGRARAQTRRSGNPKRGKSVAVSRNDVIDVTRSPESSSTMSAQGVRPPSRYCANAVEPHAAVRTSREPRHPEPRPSSHARI